MLVGMQMSVVAFAVSQVFERAVGDDLVRIHVRRCACTALNHVNDKLVMQRAGPDLGIGTNNRICARCRDLQALAAPTTMTS